MGIRHNRVEIRVEYIRHLYIKTLKYLWHVNCKSSFESTIMYQTRISHQWIFVLTGISYMFQESLDSIFILKSWTCYSIEFYHVLLLIEFHCILNFLDVKQLIMLWNLCWSMCYWTILYTTSSRLDDSAIGRGVTPFWFKKIPK